MKRYCLESYNIRYYVLNSIICVCVPLFAEFQAFSQYLLGLTDVMQYAVKNCVSKREHMFHNYAIESHNLVISVCMIYCV